MEKSSGSRQALGTAMAVLPLSSALAARDEAPTFGEMCSVRHKLVVSIHDQGSGDVLWTKIDIGSK